GTPPGGLGEHGAHGGQGSANAGEHGGIALDPKSQPQRCGSQSTTADRAPSPAAAARPADDPVGKKAAECAAKRSAGQHHPGEPAGEERVYIPAAFEVGGIPGEIDVRDKGATANNAAQ